MEFGAFVNFFGAKDGLVHISQLAEPRAEDLPTWSRKATRSGSSCSASTTAARSRLSMKVVDQATGEDLEAKQKTEDAGPREAAGE